MPSRRTAANHAATITCRDSQAQPRPPATSDFADTWSDAPSLRNAGCQPAFLTFPGRATASAITVFALAPSSGFSSVASQNRRQAAGVTEEHSLPTQKSGGASVDVRK